jgi:hypothetical protein
MIRLLPAFALLACGALAQTPVLGLPAGPAAELSKPRNLDFEGGAEGEAPADWYVAQDSRIAGYSVELRKLGCHAGTGCAVIVAGPKAESNGAGTLAQAFDGTPYREKTMRLRAWVRLDGGRRGERVRVVFAVDGEKKSAEYVQKGGVRSGEWTIAEVTGKVPKDASEIHIAVTMQGKGKAWIDDVVFEAVE